MTKQITYSEAELSIVLDAFREANECLKAQEGVDLIYYMEMCCPKTEEELGMLALVKEILKKGEEQNDN